MTDDWTESDMQQFIFNMRADCERRASAMDALLIDVAQNDTTVAMFLRWWKSGCGESLEMTLARIIVQLASEKERYMKMAVNVELQSPKTIILNSDVNTIGSRTES